MEQGKQSNQDDVPFSLNLRSALGPERDCHISAERKTLRPIVPTFYRLLFT